jgi:hypothetical protein
MKSATANIVLHGAIFVGGTEQGQCSFERKISSAGDVGSAGISGLIDVTSASTDIDFRLRHDNGGAVNITLTHANLHLEYIGET